MHPPSTTKKRPPHHPDSGREEGLLNSYILLTPLVRIFMVGVINSYIMLTLCGSSFSSQSISRPSSSIIYSRPVSFAFAPRELIGSLFVFLCGFQHVIRLLYSVYNVYSI